jgi:hypothetical protein
MRRATIETVGLSWVWLAVMWVALAAGILLSLFLRR